MMLKKVLLGTQKISVEILGWSKQRVSEAPPKKWVKAPYTYH